ncbi:MAG: hypothetical protein WAN61_02835 [Minisyncoccia bacterium]
MSILSDNQKNILSLLAKEKIIFFLELENDFIKTEFTYFPFPVIEKGENIGNLKIDSLLDIAVNKVFTIYQNWNDA